MKIKDTKLLLFTYFVVLNIIDAVTTIHLIQLVGSYSIEVNPIMHWLLVTTDTIHTVWVVKLIVLYPIGIYLHKVSNTMMLALCILFSVIVVNNLLWISYY